jgi:hypothetical protein
MKMASLAMCNGKRRADGKIEDEPEQKLKVNYAIETPPDGEMCGRSQKQQS